MMADLVAGQWADRMTRELAARRAREPEPGIAPAVTPAELNARGLLYVVFGRSA